MVMYKPANGPVLQQFSLKGQVAVVAGGARGIGLEVSRGLAEAGADVALLYSTSTSAPSIAASLSTETSTTCRAYQCNITDPAATAAVIARIHADFGRLDILVANAGVTSNVPAEDYTPAQFGDIMKVNLDGAFYSAQEAARLWIRLQKEGKMVRGSGKIVITASVSATLVNVPQKQAAYNASKAAVKQLARCLAVEWVDTCRINCISPGFIDTDMLDVHPAEWRQKWYDMVPAGRFADASELKGAYVFCASDASSYMTGSEIIIDGAYTLP